MIYHEDIKLSNHAVGTKVIEYIVSDRGCWICTSHGKDKDGYTKIARNNRSLRLHRYVYEIENGPIPNGMVVLHSCDTPACFNPKHLSLGSNLDNQRDKVKKQRQAKGEVNGSAKITEDDVRDIRKDPRYCREIAVDYGLSFTTISAIKLRKIWSHVS